MAAVDVVRRRVDESSFKRIYRRFTPKRLQSPKLSHNIGKGNHNEVGDEIEENVERKESACGRELTGNLDETRLPRHSHRQKLWGKGGCLLFKRPHGEKEWSPMEDDESIRLQKIAENVRSTIAEVDEFYKEMSPEPTSELDQALSTLQENLSKIASTLGNLDPTEDRGRKRWVGESSQQKPMDENDGVVKGEDRASREKLLTEWEAVHNRTIGLLRSYQSKSKEKNRSWLPMCLCKSSENDTFIAVLEEISSRAQTCQEHLKSLCSQGTETITLDAPHGDLLSIEGDLVGIHHRKEKVINLLLEDISDPKLEEIWITGETGIGKTTLVSKVCEDVRIREHFNIIVWITQYDVCPELMHHYVLGRLAIEIKEELPNDFYSMNIPVLTRWSHGLLQKVRLLIIFDDFCHTVLPDFIKSILRKSVHGSKTIITTTRQLGLQGSAQQICELKKLSEEESQALFRLKLFNGKDCECPPQVMECCAQMLQSYNGLPEAIVLLSYLWRRWEGKIKDEWELIIPQVKESPEFGHIIRVLSFLSKCDSSTKFAFLYLSIFPRNSLIDCRRFIRQCFVAAFVGSRSDSFPTVETDVRNDSFCTVETNVRKDIVHELRENGMIEVVEETSEGNLRTFRLNDDVQKIIGSMSESRNIISPTRMKKIVTPEKIRHLGVQEWPKGLEKRELSLTVSLLVSDLSSDMGETRILDPSPSEACNELLGSCCFLRMLDLTGAPLKTVPGALFTLIFLTYLSLRDTSIKSIPSLIGNLECLLFLDLKGTFVSELPFETKKLKKIQHILVYHYENYGNYNLEGFKAPASAIGELELVEKLCFVESDSDILTQLGQLKELRRVGITKLRASDGKILCSSLDKLRKLESLNIHALYEDETIDLHDLTSPPTKLQHLYLYGRLGKLPDWLPKTHSLTKIMLRWSQLENDIASSLGELPNLVELNLCRAYDGDELKFKDGQFQKLEILLLDELGGLISVTFEEGAMPSLKKVTIVCCPWLDGIPLGIEHLPKVEELLFFDMPDEFEEMVRVDIKEGDYDRIKDKVHFVRWRPARWDRTPFEYEEDGSVVTRTQTPSEYDEDGGFGDESRAYD